MSNPSERKNNMIFETKHHKMVADLLRMQFDEYALKATDEKLNIEQRLLNESRKSATINIISKFADMFNIDSNDFDYENFLKECINERFIHPGNS